MRNFWVAIISVLMIASFAGSSFATAPIAQDIPDIKLLTTSGAVQDFDLDAYVTDYDEDPEDLTWTIESQTGFDSNPASNTDNLVDIAASAVVDQGVVTYRVTDMSAEYSEDTQVIKYSTINVAQPALTEDNNLSPADAFPRTWVVQGENDTTTPSVLDLITPSGTITSQDLTVSIADLDGNWLAGDNVSAVTYGDLSAMIDNDGKLVLSAPAGSYPLSGLLQLSGAYRVGVKAKVPGGVGEANWDGMEVTVSQARFPSIRKLPTTEWLEQFMNFESVPAGALPVGFNAMRNLADDVNPHWYVGAAGGTATAAIVDSGIPTSAWATDGTQALKVTLTTAGDTMFIQSDRFSDIQPGETITVAANVTTTAGVDDVVPTVWLFMGSFQSPSNYNGFVVQQGGVTTGTEQVPVNGEWRTLQATFTADTFGNALDGSAVNTYAAQGYQVAIVVGGANLTLPLSVYIDNVRVYRDQTIVDKAFGATKVDVVKNLATTELFDGTFEAAATLAGNGWTIFSGVGAAEIDVNANHQNNMFNHDGSNSLELYFNTPASRGATGLSEFVYADVRLNATTAGGADNSGNGIYALTTWFKTDGAEPKDAPGLMFGLADLNFKNVAFSDAGYAGAPLDGKWKQVSMQSVRLDATRLKIFAIARADSQTLIESISTRLTPYSGTASPGYEADAHIYIDDVQIHKYMDAANYFDRSVFPATD